MDTHHVEDLFNEMIENINFSKEKLMQYCLKNNYQKR